MHAMESVDRTITMEKSGTRIVMGSPCSGLGTLPPLGIPLVFGLERKRQVQSG
jgi:hypothetical protein